MAISVKDIQEKVFATQAQDGYNVEQVDDFLDELATQIGANAREIQTLNATVQELNAKLVSADQNIAQIQKRLPDYDEGQYFKNLEKAVREALTGAQRIADATVAEANQKAQRIVECANSRAEKTIAEAEAQAQERTQSVEKEVAELSAEAERLRTAADEYRKNFSKLIQDQLGALKASDSLLK